MKVLHAPANIGNQPWILSRYERQLGVDSDLVVNRATWFGYPADTVLSPAEGSAEDGLRRRLTAALRAPLDYDVLHYYFGRTLTCWDDYVTGSHFAYLDLEIARRLGRRIFFTLQGCDVRIAAESNRRNAVTPCREGACDQFGACIARLDRKRREFIADILPRADRVFFLNPELGHFVPNGEFLPYSSVDIGAYKVSPPRMDRPPRVVHAPSDAAIKGTSLILAALAALEKHYEFELVLVRDMPHAQALDVYRDADIVIDQVLAGWYGGFAVEAMAMGKPVLCYLREEDFGFVPGDMIADMPVRNVRPDRLAEDIAAVLDRRAEWPEWSVRSRRFVEKWHDPRIVAGAMVDAYRNPDARFGLLDRVRSAASHGPEPFSTGVVSAV